jgi:hypothetical protein
MENKNPVSLNFTTEHDHINCKNDLILPSDLLGNSINADIIATGAMMASFFATAPPDRLWPPPGSEGDPTHLNVVPRLRMREAIPPLPNTSSRRGS